MKKLAYCMVLFALSMVTFAGCNNGAADKPSDDGAKQTETTGGDAGGDAAADKTEDASGGSDTKGAE